MLKNGKYFYPPPKDGGDFKVLFKRLAAVGAGRSVDENGFPSGPWTPELLTKAISKIDSNRNGIDLRTVQLWFQDNDKGVSNDNIRWLARVFGCDDPDATREWQVELSAAQSRLASKRRENRDKAIDPTALGFSMNVQPVEDDGASQRRMDLDGDATEPTLTFGLAKKMEELFTERSPLDLPILVFAAAVILGFTAYMLDIHSVTYGTAQRPVKQVGFIWAPNWTALFLVFMPIYLAFVTEMLVFWKYEGRSRLLKLEGRKIECNVGWNRKIRASSHSYWVIFAVSLPVVFLLQWVDICLIPLLTGNPGNLAMDWGRIAIVRPEVISVSQAIIFTGVAYFYMGTVVFLFFVGLNLIATVAQDFWETARTSELRTDLKHKKNVMEIGCKLKIGIFRCTILGIMVTICLKLQSGFMQSEAEDIVSWFLSDIESVFSRRDLVIDSLGYKIPTHYSSLLAVLATCAVFLISSVRIHEVLGQSGPKELPHGKNQERPDHDREAQNNVPWKKMTAVVALLVASYLFIGVFVGFSILLSFGVLVAIYGLFDPDLGQAQKR